MIAICLKMCPLCWAQKQFSLQVSSIIEEKGKKIQASNQDLENVSVLNASSNELTSLAGAECYPHLHSLLLSQNQITTLALVPTSINLAISYCSSLRNAIFEAAECHIAMCNYLHLRCIRALWLSHLDLII